MSHAISRSVVGRPKVYIVFAEVWADQIDEHGEPCKICQELGALIECNVYVPESDGDTITWGACRCCAPISVLDHSNLDPTRDALIEYSKGHRL
jgi:hypothetical protein